MKWLVTGAGGFLGSRVVTKLLNQGEQVRAMVRPASDLSRVAWADRVDVFRGDLRRCPNLAEALEGVDGLVHLAAAVSGTPEEQFASTVVGTEKLLEAMAKSTRGAACSWSAVFPFTTGDGHDIDSTKRLLWSRTGCTSGMATRSPRCGRSDSSASTPIVTGGN